MRFSVSRILPTPRGFFRTWLSLTTAFLVTVSPGAIGLGSIFFILSGGGTARAITGCTCGCTGDCNASSSCSCTNESSTPVPTGNLINPATNLAPGTYNVTPFFNDAYVFNGVQNPDLTLIRGQTYTFNINATGHPFAIKSVQGPTQSNVWNEGVTNNETDLGTVTFVVPQDAPDNLFYNCEIHDAMTGNLFIVDPDTFNVTNDGANAYIINSASNPDLTLVRGHTYTFNVNAAGHPFAIKSVQDPGNGDLWNEGVTNNEVEVGAVTFLVPQDAPDTLFYDCEIHSAMTGTLHIISIGSGDGSLLSATQTVNSGVHLPGSNVTLTVVIANSSTHAQPDNPARNLRRLFQRIYPLSAPLPIPARPRRRLPAPETVARFPGTAASRRPAPSRSRLLPKSAPPRLATISQFRATVYYDSDNDGTNESNALTDDPGTAAANDANTVHVASVILSARQTVSGAFVPNGPVTYTIVITNSGTGPQADNSGHEFSETFPSSLHVTGVSAPSGTAAFNGNDVTWDGALAAAGTVAITVHATIDSATTDGQAISAQGDLSYDFDIDGTNETAGQTYAPPLNGTPQPTVLTVHNPTDYAFISGTKAGSFNALANDSAGGVTLSVTGVTQGQHGTVTFSSTGILRYVPNGKLLVGGDSFTYTVSDGNGGTYTATVMVRDFSEIAANYNGLVLPPGWHQ